VRSTGLRASELRRQGSETVASTTFGLSAVRVGRLDIVGDVVVKAVTGSPVWCECYASSDAEYDDAVGILATARLCLEWPLAVVSHRTRQSSRVSESSDTSRLRNAVVARPRPSGELIELTA